MYSFVSEEIGTLIVNSVLLFLAFVVFLLVTLAILTVVLVDPAANLMKTTLSQCSKESNYITHKRTYGFVYENLHNWNCNFEAR